MILPQEVGTFGNNIEKEPQKPRPKIRILCIYREYLLSLQSNGSGSFLQNLLNLKVT